MIIVDGHCDTVLRSYLKDEDMYKNDAHLDFERLVRFGGYVQFFAAFIEPMYCQAYAMKRAVQLLDRLHQQIEKHKDSITLCCNYNDIITAVESGRIAAISSIEGGDALQGDISALRAFYRLGVRSLGLTWNHRNEIADGVFDSKSHGGLTDFGVKVIKEMNSLGMIADVSHISEPGFWDVINISSKPIIASHSNAKAICGHKRNLSDHQILALKKNGGVMGINFYSVFLNDSGSASVTDIIRHIEHISGLVGVENIGLGSDFDGIESTPVDIKEVSDICKIFNELAKLNYTQQAIDAIAGGNFLRVIREVC